MTSLKAKLSASSVRNLVHEVNRYETELRVKCDKLCRRLGEIGVETAVSIVPVETGSLRDSISLMKRGESHYVVVADCEYAAFVEFGTGVVGRGTYQHELPEGWQYLQNPPRSPWAHDPDDVSTWHYLGDDGAFHSTRGQEGAGFMGSAAEAMRQKVFETAKEVFA